MRIFVEKRAIFNKIMLLQRKRFFGFSKVGTRFPYSTKTKKELTYAHIVKECLMEENMATIFKVLFDNLSNFCIRLQILSQSLPRRKFYIKFGWIWGATDKYASVQRGNCQVFQPNNSSTIAIDKIQNGSNRYWSKWKCSIQKLIKLKQEWLNSISQHFSGS